MRNDNDIVIVAAKRTPFVKSGLNFKKVHPVLLGQTVVKALLDEVNFSRDKVDEVIVGNTGNPTDAMNIARVIALRSQLPLKTSSFSVHRNCASGLESICTAYDKIRSGSCDIVVSAGVENMSQLPLLYQDSFSDLLGEVMFSKSVLKKIKSILKIRLKHFKPRFSIVEGLTDPFCGILMGDTAEVLAKQFSINRLEQDEFALLSHKRALKAQSSARFSKEIVPVYVPDKGFVLDDVGPREDQSLKKLTKLRPYFDRKYGSVTVGNSCPITDGAAGVILMRRQKALELGCSILASIKSYHFGGLEPDKMGLGPVYATAGVLKKLNMSLADMDLIELNEAFAAQVLACKRAFESDDFCQKELGLTHSLGKLDLDKVNVNGGAIALGHPVGATGARLVSTLVYEMKLRQARFSLATLCIGGGQGGAMVLENEALG